MGVFKNFLPFLMALCFVMSAVADEAVKGEAKTDAKKDTSVVENVIILPFHNFTDSGLKYLETYIPEIMKNNMSIDSRIKIQDAADLSSEFNKRKLTAGDLYNTETITAFLKEIECDVAIKGRYLVSGKKIKIELKAVYTDGTMITGPVWDGTVDDNILGSIEKFALSRDEWFREFVIDKTLSKFEAEKSTSITGIIERVKKSKFGIIISNKWVFSAMIIVFFLVLARIMVVFFEKILKKLTSKTTTDADEELVDRTKKPLKWLLIVLGFRLAVPVLGMKTSTALLLKNFSVALIILFITMIFTHVVDVLIRSWGHRVTARIDSRIENDLVPLFVNITKIIVVATGLLMILSQFDIDITPFIASLGVAGFAIGFAVKDTLANVIGGVVLILDRSFVVGDKVTVDDQTGVIKEVGLRNTKLVTYDNEIIVIPNGELMNKQFKNYVLPDPKIRVIVNFGVAYGCDLDEVTNLVSGVIQGISPICTDPAPSVVCYEMGDFSLNFQAKFWVPDYADQYGKKIEATKLIYDALNKAGIEIPFPTQTLYVKKEDQG